VRAGGGSGFVPRRCLPVLGVVVLVLAACGEPVSTPEPVILQAAGSMEMAPLLGELAAAFGQENPLVSLEVTGLGTEYGLQALRAGDVDVAMASWLPPEPQRGWRATAIARDGLAVIVHPDNPVDGLGLLQLQTLYSGQVYEWRALSRSAAPGEVEPVCREEGSGTRAAFDALVMDGARLTPWAVVASSPEAVVEYVAGHPRAIGYVSMAFVTPDVKVLKIEGALPTPEGAAQGSYALTRELWILTADPPPEGVQAWLDFVASPAGQRIVGRQHGRVK
jgi:phosphate transport system substrate-binding protein